MALSSNTAKFRRGDICTIEVVVTSSFNDTQVSVKPVDGYSDIYVKPRDLTMKRPKIEVGDTVRCPPRGTGTGVVRAIGNDHAWVEIGAGEFVTWWMGQVERVDLETERSDGGANIVTKHENIAGEAA